MAVASMILGHELGKTLADAGLIPPLTKRLSIDISADDIVTATFSSYIDQKLLDAIWPYITQMQRCELLVKPNTDGTFTVTRRLIATDDRWCDHCEDYTEQTFKSGEHERDSSGDFQECLRCHWRRFGYSDWQPPFRQDSDSLWLIKPKSGDGLTGSLLCDPDWSEWQVLDQWCMGHGKNSDEYTACKAEL